MHSIFTSVSRVHPQNNVACLARNVDGEPRGRRECGETGNVVQQKGGVHFGRVGEVGWSGGGGGVVSSRVGLGWISQGARLKQWVSESDCPRRPRLGGYATMG